MAEWNKSIAAEEQDGMAEWWQEDSSVCPSNDNPNGQHERHQRVALLLLSCSIIPGLIAAVVLITLILLLADTTMFFGVAISALFGSLLSLLPLPCIAAAKTSSRKTRGFKILLFVQLILSLVLSIVCLVFFLPQDICASNFQIAEPGVTGGSSSLGISVELAANINNPNHFGATIEYADGTVEYQSEILGIVYSTANTSSIRVGPHASRFVEAELIFQPDLSGLSGSAGLSLAQKCIFGNKVEVDINLTLYMDILSSGFQRAFDLPALAAWFSCDSDELLTPSSSDDTAEEGESYCVKL
uniref:Uncharacterized protein n=1 Tax=Heterosigma akashiwo TaxID=2829 RepID=A0A7S3XY50_HETAK